MISNVMILVGFINRFTSYRERRVVEKRGKKESTVSMAVHLLLKKYIDSFLTELERVPLKYDPIVLSRFADAQAVSFRLEEKATAKISFLRCAREKMIEH